MYSGLIKRRMAESCSDWCLFELTQKGQSGRRVLRIAPALSLKACRQSRSVADLSQSAYPHDVVGKRQSGGTVSLPDIRGALRWTDFET